MAGMRLKLWDFMLGLRGIPLSSALDFIEVAHKSVLFYSEIPELAENN